MFKALMCVGLVLAFSQALCMDKKNPCNPWRDAMVQACKTGTVNRALLAQVEAQVKKNGCTWVRFDDSKNHKNLFEQAGADAMCPAFLGAFHGLPLYKAGECTYSKEFKS